MKTKTFLRERFIKIKINLHAKLYTESQVIDEFSNTVISTLKMFKDSEIFIQAICAKEICCKTSEVSRHFNSSLIRKESLTESL